MRYRLRTLMIVVALGPPVLAGIWFGYQDYKSRQGTHLEWGGAVTIPAEGSVPIGFDELEAAVRDNLAP